jgi:type I restriction-modification system DNA methylase subunit
VGAPAEVLDLVERFARNRDAYLSGAYNETQVRREFIDPLFGALGWDVDNRAGYAEAYKDVIHEDAIKTSFGTKAPDYCFRIGGARKFFVEAKKPSVNVKDDVAPAYQLRRYAWSAKLPLSILTDFEEFAVYDCRVRPDKADRASMGRTLYLLYTDYDGRWEEIAGIFAKEAVLQGSFDRYAESTKSKKGTAEVDAAFLSEIEGWRDLLARHIALRNGALSQRELNYAVQATIDRLIFLRICEDRGTEAYGRLQGLLNGQNTYARLLSLYREADQRYNSGLFHFERERGRHEAPDELTPSLALDDKPLKEIIGRLYYPDSPYEFSVLPADILGQVYEQFLGKVIRLTAGHRAVVEDKPEVKKAGGVYYTPTYIVDYIVKNTVGKLLEGKTPKQAASLRILDPACGSGSFLIGAYQCLLDWHRDWCVADGPAKHTKELFQGPGGEWRLTTSVKKQILLNNIYGVDIDAQAVETTKLSLLLKVLEGETAESINSQLSFLRERALPDLAANIKCGNSLIGPDFYDDQQLGLLLDEEERYRINVFDWQAEYPQILGAGVPEAKRGFDAVIGNPPYGADYDAIQKLYFQARYVYRKGKPETYMYFLETGARLLSPLGLLGFITPNAWLTNHYGEQLRRHLLSGYDFTDVADLEPVRVFRNAVVDTAIVVLGTDRARRTDGLVRVWRGVRDGGIEQAFAVPQAMWGLDIACVINIQANPTELAVIDRIERDAVRLETLVDYSQGIIPYKTRVDGERNDYIAPRPADGDWMPLIENASQVRRYEIDPPRSYLNYGPWLWCQRDSKYFSRPKILFHRLRKKLPRQLVGAYDDTGLVSSPGTRLTLWLR